MLGNNDLTIKNLKSKLVIKYKDEKFIVINKKLLESVLGVCTSTPIPNVERIEDDEPELAAPDHDKVIHKAKMLVVEYLKQKSVFYGGRRSMSITQEHPDFKFFRLASEFLVLNNIDVKTFIKAQIKGWSFANEGSGAYPLPRNLHTTMAEDHCLNYLRKEELDNDKATTEGSLFSDYDRKKPLESNTKYQRIYKKYKNNVANLSEARYLLKCQKIHNGSMSVELKAYTKNLRK